MVRVARIHKTGKADVLSVEEIEVGAPGEGEIRVRQTICGLNYIDIYHRSGLYPLATLPAVIGMEAAGVVEAVGPGVSNLAEGDRIAYPAPLGAYASERVMPAWRAVRLPDTIADETAAAMMLKGLTAHYLLHHTYRVKPGDPILVYAAAGGVGQILCQWGTHLGAMVIGCVGSDEKAVIARAAGAAHTINYTHENIAERTRALTGGEGVAVAYDSVGKATMMDSIGSLRPFGTYASYGNASGKPEPLDLSLLAPAGSLYVTRPTLATHIATPAHLQRCAEALFDVVTKGIVTISINQRYALDDVVRAHADLEARKTTGSTILIV